MHNDRRASASPTSLDDLILTRAMLLVGLDAPESETREALDSVCSIMRSALMYAATRRDDGVEGALSELDEFVEWLRVRRRQRDRERDSERNASAELKQKG